MLSKNFLFVMGAVASSAAALFAQAQPPQPAQTTTSAAVSETGYDGGEPHYLKPETPEQRKARLGTPEDPGHDPDPDKHFWRFGKSYHIEKFDRRFEAWDRVDPGFVRPLAFVIFQREVYELNDKWLWVWTLDAISRDDAPVQPPTRYSAEALNYLQDMRSEFSEFTPKAGAKTIRFEKASQGLPTSGSWRNSLAVADMNGDGCPDIIAPAQRKGNEVPAIFLGDCKGQWKLWRDVNWPHGVDYGSVVAADFNRDGHMDLAFGVHLQGIYVMLGDGKGNFKEVSGGGLPRNFGTRRIVVADIDRDGYPDIVALSEGPSAAASDSKGRLRIYFNRKKGLAWEETDVADAKQQVAGDWLTVAHLTGDSHLDMIAATIFANSNQVMYLSDGPKKWKSITDPRLIPYLSSYAANAAGKFASKRQEDAIISYVRRWPSDVPELIPDPPSKSVVGIDRISFAGKQPKRTSIVRWPGNREITGLAVGDFDGDGNLDLIYTRYDPREAVILLGDGKGGFKKASVEGLTLEPNTNYDITVADVNGDGKPDIILMYESSASTVLAAQNGSIQVFLNRGVSAPAIEAKK